MTGDLVYRAMRADDADLELFAACFARNDTARPIDALRWQYLENPTGRVYVDFAVAGDTLAAIYATLPVWLRVEGRVVLGVQSLDTLTDTRFRGRGLFAKLARSTFDRAATDGVALIYGFPNGSSAPGFFGKLGWRSLDPVPFLIRPLRSRYVLGRLHATLRTLPDLPLPVPAPSFESRHSLREIERFDDGATELWADFSGEVGVGVERDARYLNWRFCDKPGEAYRRFGLYAGRRLVALVVTALKSKHDGQIGYVMELLHRSSDAALGRQLLAHALNDLSRRGADVALAWNLPHSPNRRAYLRNAFVPFPERLRPIELHCGTRVFAPSLGVDPYSRLQWYLSYADSDTV